MIRRIVLAALGLGLLATPALAFEVKQAPAPRAGEGAAFGDFGMLSRMMPAATSEAFRFGPAEQKTAEQPKVIYELKAGKSSDRVDVTNARDNPFMPQPERSSRSAH